MKIHMIILGVLVGLSLVLVSCGVGVNLGSKKVFLNQDFMLGYNQTASIVTEKMQIRFDKVVGDSRCPIDMQCVLAGDATVEIVVMRNNAEHRYPLSSAANTVNVDGVYEILLKDVDPQPTGRRTLEPQEYQITLYVRKI